MNGPEIKKEPEAKVSASGSGLNKDKHDADKKTARDDGAEESAMKETQKEIDEGTGEKSAEKDTHDDTDKGKGKERAIDGPRKSALSEYEQTRLLNIEENKARLKELFPEGTSNIFGTKSAVEKRARGPKVKADSTQRRTSARHSAIKWVAQYMKEESIHSHIDFRSTSTLSETSAEPTVNLELSLPPAENSSITLSTQKPSDVVEVMNTIDKHTEPAALTAPAFDVAGGVQLKEVTTGANGDVGLQESMDVSEIKDGMMDADAEGGGTSSAPVGVVENIEITNKGNSPTGDVTTTPKFVDNNTGSAATISPDTDNSHVNATGTAVDSLSPAAVDSLSPAAVNALSPAAVDTLSPTAVVASSHRLAHNSRSRSSTPTPSKSASNPPDALSSGAADKTLTPVSSEVGESASVRSTPTVDNAVIDEGCPIWLAHTLNYLRATSANASWQELITELVRFEKQTPPTGVSCLIFSVYFSVLNA